jgi:hypothetical protein
MNRVERWGHAVRAAQFWVVTFAAAALLAGCGMPGAPLPPSLNLPEKATDLAAVRNGDQVTLTWTMPRRNTDKLLLKGPVQARVCRMEWTMGSATASGVNACAAAGSTQFAPGADASFTETLPSPLAASPARTLTYFVEIVNHKGRSAGRSNGASVAAGQVPAAIAGLTAEMRRKGVLLAWQPDVEGAGSTGIRLVRKLLTPPPPKQKPKSANAQSGTQEEPGAQRDSASGLLTPPAEPLERTLLVKSGAQARALDEDVRFNERYEYRAQRVATVEANGKTLELAGPLSAPVEIETKNTFPPAVPTGLAAVGTAGENGSGNEARPAIDLNWQPNTEADLAGYAVYRREGSGEWQRISPAQPVVGSGFHDANVTAGHTYRYAVSSIDQEGHESARSAETEETAPEQ